MTPDSTFLIGPEEILEANRRWDRENGNPYHAKKVKPAWNENRLLRRGKLTDKAIKKYMQLGYYSAELREARKELQRKKQARRDKREGNFDVREGRMIFNPW